MNTKQFTVSEFSDKKTDQIQGDICPSYCNQRYHTKQSPISLLMRDFNDAVNNQDHFAIHQYIAEASENYHGDLQYNAYELGMIVDGEIEACLNLENGEFWSTPKCTIRDYC